MKFINYSIIAFILILFSFSGTNLKAMNWEVGIRVLNNNNTYASKLIIVYKYDFSAKKLIFHGQGYSVADSAYDYAGNRNAAFDIGDSDT